MKSKLTIIAVVFFAVNSFGQMMSYISNLQISGSGISVAELSLIHRSRADYKDISDLGAQFIMIPNNLNGKKLKIEFNRFRTLEGDPFEMESKTYVPVNLYYDNETSDPRDDVFIVAIPFPVGKKLVQKELEYYEGQKLITANFEMASEGVSTNQIRH